MNPNLNLNLTKIKKKILPRIDNSFNNKSHDPWLVDTPNERDQNKFYDNNNNNKLPQLTHKQMYDLMNTMTNRKPVRVNESDNIFGSTDKNKENIPNQQRKIKKSNVSNFNENSSDSTPRSKSVQINEVCYNLF